MTICFSFKNQMEANDKGQKQQRQQLSFCADRFLYDSSYDWVCCFRLVPYFVWVSTRLE